MRSPLELILFIAVIASATMLTRFLPFMVPGRWLDNAVVRKMRDGLPAVILLLLLIFSLKDAPILQAPHGLPELLALAVVLALQYWKSNALLSITAGTGLYMILVQTGALSRLFM